ncbi:branched-chain amino acid ABC transporter permease [Qaidamihabitans albus]|uniref:branched-chain amino acid ABC transporter permease n=1 Tax=Qaidamihabitans albus TaxID=2795733 RepID=UPI0018F1127F|nr:branched-chain amino acid ABC transporter permease [Qaidamihabitans albus]
MLNALILGCAVGSLYALLGVSLQVIYTPTRIFHLAHGAVFAVAGYAVHETVVRHGAPILVGVVAAIVVAVAVGVVVELAIYRPLRRRGASHLITFIASASVLGLVQALLAVRYGPAQVGVGLDVRNLSEKLSLSTAQVATMVVAAAVVVPTTVWFARSGLGRSLRAVGDSPEAAERRGLPVGRLYLAAFAVGSALVAPAAVLQGWAIGLRPDMGFEAALFATATVLVAGSRGILATAAVGLGLGVVQGMSLLVLSSGWQEGVTFLVLFLVVVTPYLVRRKEAVPR